MVLRLCLAVAWAAWTTKLALNNSNEGPGYIPGFFLVSTGLAACLTALRSSVRPCLYFSVVLGKFIIPGNVSKSIR